MEGKSVMGGGRVLSVVILLFGLDRVVFSFRQPRNSKTYDTIIMGFEYFEASQVLTCGALLSTPLRGVNFVLVRWNNMLEQGQVRSEGVVSPC
jgi:hypothetical protein